MRSRSAALERLGTGVFDLLVIGGGIVGSRVALDASRAGMRVALVDAGDFAGATSGVSAGLVHGGLRYLRRGALRLAREACRERNALASRVAPHLVRPLPMVAACAGGPRRYAETVAGLSLYAALGGRGWPLPRPVSRRYTAGHMPALDPHRAGPVGLFYEAAVDDARLTLATVAAADHAGAVVVNHLGVQDLGVVADGVSEALVTGGEGDLRVRARGVVNATGPWTDAVRRMEDPRCRPLTRLSKGVHVALGLSGPLRTGVAVSLEGGDHLYALPRDDVLLLGTTDEPYAGDPAAVRATAPEVAALLDRASPYLPGVGSAPVLSAFAGLRVLARGAGATVDAPRDHLVGVGPGGMVSVAGGKLTTHRLIARDALGRLPASIRPRRVRGGGPLAARTSAFPAPDAIPTGATMRHLARVYGLEAGAVLARSAGVPGALDPVNPDGPDVWAQVYYAAANEWALTVEDVTRRRTSLALRGLDTPAVRATIAGALDRLGNSSLSRERTA